MDTQVNTQFTAPIQNVSVDDVPVENPVQETQLAPSVDKEELKNLLHDIVQDIHTDKTSEESVAKLIQEFHAAKNDFFLICKQVEATIEKITSSKENK